MNLYDTDKNIAIGVDIGGTKISAGMVTTKGEVVGRPVSVPTGAEDEKEKIMARITGSIESVMENHGIEKERISGIGLGVTGPLDTGNGTILECPQLPTLHFYPLKEKIQNQFGFPVFMDNDANSLVLGESLWGAGKDCSIVLGYTLGTGLGCALVVNGKLFAGANGMAGEIWPSPFGDGTIEDVVSGNGISAIYKGLAGTSKTAKEISGLAGHGDPDAKKAWELFGRALAAALAWGINMVDPDIVILGGSIVNSLPLFSGVMEETLRKYICPVPAGKTKIVKAMFGDHAGFIGAAGLVIQGSK